MAGVARDDFVSEGAVPTTNTEYITRVRWTEEDCRLVTNK